MRKFGMLVGFAARMTGASVCVVYHMFRFTYYDVAYRLVRRFM